MTFEELQKANQSIVTTDIKGKEYAEVNQRIKAFRMLYPEGCIKTELVSNADGVCVFKAWVYTRTEDGVGTLLGTGHAYERESSSFINKTSYIENCETSAVGRALGMCGFGIDTSVCSADELNNALLQQDANKQITKAQVKTLVALAEAKGSDLSDICDYFKVGSLNEMTAEEYGKCLNMLNAKGGK
ncbi:MAG: hypothetical protein IKE94_06595 [Aeriscardovia sp.]|nr:hypothetical protein [Aeriscardovia sp.]